ncbi:c6 zinc finger [Fusarium longipes]|uniref:C6 zinc finger n=1 Tax=Fusarium longipes TaxID=694270 RepID=A0A395T0Z3_9HYPO|nr:c6 zinc finger [Fusarium longipes]
MSRRCARLSIPCGGYAPRIIFKDQTKLFNQDSPRRTRSGQRLGELVTDTTVELGQQDEAGDTFIPEGDSPAQEYLTPYVAATDPGNDTIHTQSPVYHIGQPNTAIHSSLPLNDSEISSTWGTGLIQAPLVTTGSNTPVNDHHGPYMASPAITPGASSHTPYAHATPNFSSPQISIPSQVGGDKFFGIRVSPMIPHGLFESMKFPEDMLYYHHLRDTGPYGVLSVLYLNDILDAEYLNGSFYHAALALSALKISKSDAHSHLRNQASIHALEHFVVALGDIGKIEVEDINTPGNAQNPRKRENAVSWLSTVLLLAHFELKRGQMRLWCVHGRAAVDFLSSHLALVRATDIGESLVRAFSRIAALLVIYERTHSIQQQAISPEVSSSLIELLATSDLPYDRLIYICPRVNALEEEWRANLRPDARWDERVDRLRIELEEWKLSLPPEEVPDFGDEENIEGPDLDIQPLTILSSQEPVRAATNYAHYLVCMLRLDMMYSSETGPRITPAQSASTIHKICRLTLGLPYTLCVSVNNYGHGMLPAMLDAYHMADENMGNWIKRWISSRPDTREGIWDIERVQRLIAYLDREYKGQGSRSGWAVIKTRMVDEEDDGHGQGNDVTDRESRCFCVEIYSKGKRGWSIDFVEIE